MNNPYNQAPNPQNNAYPSAQGQTGRYPTLSAPQNYQGQHPFPAHQYAQQNQHYPQGIVQAGPGNMYNPSHKPENAESLLNEARIRELDQSLNTCFMQFYKVWLWLSIFGFTFGGADFFYSLIMGRPYMLPILQAVLGAYSFWNTIQSIFGLIAMARKSLTMAKVTVWMMILYFISTLAVGIWLIVAIINHVPDKRDDSWPIWYAAMYSILFIDVALLLTHVFISLNGAWRVKKILEERKMIDERFNRSDDSLQA